jgi:hypothetical protein
VVEDKIFKFKHRQMADDPSTFNRRMKRVVDRFWTRAESREGSHIFDIYKKDEIEASVGQAALDPTSYKTTAMDETNAHREYVVKESVAQYKDYYESDAEEGSFFEYLDNLSNRDRIRFMEIFEDFATVKSDPAAYAMIPKREFNPELSAFSNLVLDLVDFKDRVRPMAKDLSLFDASR